MACRCLKKPQQPSANPEHLATITQTTVQQECVPISEIDVRMSRILPLIELYVENVCNSFGDTEQYTPISVTAFYHIK